MASRKGSRQFGAGAESSAGAVGVLALFSACRRQASSVSAARRASVVSSIARSHCASSSPANIRPNSSARSVVSGVAGSTRMRRRWASSPNRSTRGVKPKSASSAAVSISFQKHASNVVTRCRCSALRSSTLSKCRSRSTGATGRAALAASSPASPCSPPATGWRSHSNRRTNHRLRSARGAFGSAALSSAGKSHTGAVPIRARHQDMVSRPWAACRQAQGPSGESRTRSPGGESSTQWRAEASVRANSPTGAWNGWASSVMQK